MFYTGYMFIDFSILDLDDQIVKQLVTKSVKFYYFRYHYNPVLLPSSYTYPLSLIITHILILQL